MALTRAPTMHRGAKARAIGSATPAIALQECSRALCACTRASCTATSCAPRCPHILPQPRGTSATPPTASLPAALPAFPLLLPFASLALGLYLSLLSSLLLFFSFSPTSFSFQFFFWPMAINILCISSYVIVVTRWIFFGWVFGDFLRFFW